MRKESKGHRKRVQTITALSEKRNGRTWQEIELEKILLVVLRLPETLLDSCFG